MKTYDTWIYKNYNKKLTEKDFNGVIVAFDASGNNSLLERQVRSLQVDTQFDRKIMISEDTTMALLNTLAWAYNEGYEHLRVLAEADNVGEVESFLIQEGWSGFESIKVIPENSPRFYEAKPAPREYAYQAKMKQDAANAQKAAMDNEVNSLLKQNVPAQGQVVEGTPLNAIFIKGNPPVEGLGKILEIGLQLVLKEPNIDYRIILHKLGETEGQVFDVAARKQFLFGGEYGLGLYGDAGISPMHAKVPSKYLGKNLSKIEGPDPTKTLAQWYQKVVSSGFKLNKVYAPANAVEALKGELSQFNVEVLPINAPDVDSASKPQVLQLAQKILKDLPSTSEKEEAKKAEAKNDKNDEEGDENAAASKEAEKLEELTSEDQFAVFMLAAYKALISGEKVSDKMELFASGWKMAQEDAALIKDYMDKTGLSLGTDIAKALKGSGKSPGDIKKAQEAEKLAIEKALQVEAALGFDPKLAKNHDSFKKFQSAFEL